MKLIFKIILLLTYLLSSEASFAQTEQQNQYSFRDKYGNYFNLINWQAFPKKIDSTFFKQSLTGLDLDQKLLQSDKRYVFNIIEVVVLKPNKKYKVAVTSHITDAKINDLIKSQGLQIYFITTKKVGDKLQIDKITYDHSEI